MTIQFFIHFLLNTQIIITVKKLYAQADFFTIIRRLVWLKRGNWFKGTLTTNRNLAASKCKRHRQTKNPKLVQKNYGLAVKPRRLQVH